MSLHAKLKKSDEQGVVSLIVTIILMMVISLIVISFARTSRREQRDSLDRQLSTNAFYAAESGINMARKAIADPTKQALLTSTKYTSSCTGAGSFSAAAGVKVPSDNIGSANSNATYTCLFVDPSVSSIEHSLTAEPYSFPLKRSGPGNLGQVDIYWDAGSTSGASYTGCPSIGNNPQTWPTATCASGILRLELTDNFVNNYVYFIYPSNSPADNIPYATAASPTGTRYRANCNAANQPQQCHFQLSGLNRPVYARVSSLYASYELSVKASGGQEFAEAQVIVDATGKAADVQRRIQVRYNLNDLGGPSYALQGGSSTCKKFSVDGTNVVDGGTCWPAPSSRSGATLLP